MIKENILKITPGPIICYLAQPYVSGYSMQAGILKAADLLTQKRLSTIDLLGEEARSDHEVKATIELYSSLIKEISQSESFQENATRPTVSLKPSSLITAQYQNDTLVIDESQLEQNILTILKVAKEKSVELTIDMEDYHWTDVTLKLYKKYLEQGFTSLGTVIQSRLFRTKKDIEELPDNCRVRLCIGIYKETSDIALTEKKQMKEKLLEYAGILLDKNVYLELATHDEIYLKRFFNEVLADRPYPEGRFEVQMLLGVPRSTIQNDLIEGKLTNGKPVPVRLYVPFAVNRKDATEYSRRRLIANPDMISYGIKNILGRLSG